MAPCKRTPDMPEGAPLAVSFPHFYQAHPDYQQVCVRTVARPEAEFLNEIQTKVFRIFLLATGYYCHLYSFALRILLLQTHATSYCFYSSVTVNSKGERRKT
jgi:hypothetical protein